MTPQTPDIESVLERLDKLERQNRRLKQSALAAFVVATALVTMYATQPVPQKITAHRFDVVDDSGKMRVAISNAEGRSGIALFDAQSNPRASMTLDASGSPLMWVCDAGGKSRVSLGVFEDGPSISLRNEKGKTHIGLDPSGAPRITLADANGFQMDLGSTGAVNAKTGATEQTSAASIVMFGSDKEHHVIWQAP